MEFDQLRTLLSVLEHGSFTRASEALGLSQSTVSFHIKALETAIGCRLIDRGRDGVQVTSHGRVLHRYAQQLLTLRGEAHASLHALDRGTVGHVSIASSTIAGEYLLPPALAKLRGTHPGVSVQVSISNSQRATAALLAEECELALTGAVSRDPRVEARPFATDEVVLVVASSTAFALQADKSLAGLPLVLRNMGSGTRSAVAPLLAGYQLGEGGVPFVEVGSSEAAKRCVLEGLGAAFVSRLAVAAELAAGQLRELDLPGTPVCREFFLVTRRATTLSPAASALVAILCGPGA